MGSCRYVGQNVFRDEIDYSGQVEEYSNNIRLTSHILCWHVKMFLVLKYVPLTLRQVLSSTSLFLES